jgi:hypothetical protein
MAFSLSATDLYVSPQKKAHLASADITESKKEQALLFDGTKQLLPVRPNFHSCVAETNMMLREFVYSQHPSQLLEHSIK